MKMFRIKNGKGKKENEKINESIIRSHDHGFMYVYPRSLQQR